MNRRSTPQLARGVVPAPTLDFPGLKAMLEKYQAKGAFARHRSVGLWITPFAYAAGHWWRKQSRLRKASTTTSSRTTSIRTNSRRWPAKSPSGKDGEWTKSRQFFTQFQGVSGNDLVILWPPEYKTGNVIYPYQDAKKK